MSYLRGISLICWYIQSLIVHTENRHFHPQFLFELHYLLKTQYDIRLRHSDLFCLFDLLIIISSKQATSGAHGPDFYRSVVLQRTADLNMSSKQRYMRMVGELKVKTSQQEKSSTGSDPDLLPSTHGHHSIRKHTRANTQPAYLSTRDSGWIFISPPHRKAISFQKWLANLMRGMNMKRGRQMR